MIAHTQFPSGMSMPDSCRHGRSIETPMAQKPERVSAESGRICTVPRSDNPQRRMGDTGRLAKPTFPIPDPPTSRDATTGNLH